MTDGFIYEAHLILHGELVMGDGGDDGGGGARTMVMMNTAVVEKGG